MVAKTLRELSDEQHAEYKRRLLRMEERLRCLLALASPPDEPGATGVFFSDVELNSEEFREVFGFVRPEPGPPVEPVTIAHVDPKTRTITVSGKVKR